MKVFVLGQSGMLGRYVYSFFKSEGFDVVSVNRNSLNILDTDYSDLLLTFVLKGLRSSDVVINCAGLIRQRNSTSKLEFILGNAVFPHLLQKACEEMSCNLIHVTTDCVFSGHTGSYSELDAHDATDVYGTTKSLGEPEEATIIRTSIIGEEFKNRISLLEWVKSNRNKEVKGYTNHIWNGITCLQFAKLCKEIVLGHYYWKGVRHVFSPSVVSKFDLVKLISDVYDLDVKVVPYETETKCDRSLISVKTDIPFKIPELKGQLIEMKNFYEMLLID